MQIFFVSVVRFFLLFANGIRKRLQSSLPLTFVNSNGEERHRKYSVHKPAVT